MVLGTKPDPDRQAGTAGRILSLTLGRIRHYLGRAFAWLWRGILSVWNAATQRWRVSLQFRTVMVTMMLASLALVGVGTYLSSQIASNLFQERLRQSEQDTKVNVKAVQDTFDGAQVTDKASVQKLVTDTLETLDSRGSEMRRMYVFLAVPDQSQPRNKWVDSRASYGLGLSVLPEELRTAVQKSGKEQFWASTALQAPGGRTDPAIVLGNKVSFNGTVYELYLIYNIASAEQTLAEIQGVLLIGAAVLVLLIGAIAWYVTRSVVSPVSHAANVAEKLASGELQERMEVHGQDEMARLGASFNHMAASLQEQITQLALLSQMQQRFVSDVSHELRTPLTTVRMAADILNDAREDFDPISKRSVELLHNQVDRFQILLDDLLEISRYDAGAALLDAEPLDLVQLTFKVTEAAAPVAAEYGSEIFVHASAESVVVEMEAKRIERILRNLVMNALEHGEGRRIDVIIGRSEDAAAVAVRDYGLGLDPAEASRVFDRFWRADPARARSTGGSGLGLSIAMEDTKLHAGWLEATGAKGQGSTFRLTLPLKSQGSFAVSPVPMPSYVRAIAAPEVVVLRDPDGPADPANPTGSADRTDPTGPADLAGPEGSQGSSGEEVTPMPFSGSIITSTAAEISSAPNAGERSAGARTMIEDPETEPGQSPQSGSPKGDAHWNGARGTEEAEQS